MQHELLRLAPMRNETAIDGSDVGRIYQTGQFVDFVAGRRPSWQEGVPERWRYCCHEACSRAPRWPRHKPKLAPDPAYPEIAVVAAEQLVPSISGEAHGNVTPC